MEAIRDRRPTKADATKSGGVECWFDGEWHRYHWSNNYPQTAGVAWRPIDQTPPPKPEKPKRWKGEVWVTDFARNSHVPALETRPTDPPDLDAFLAAFDKWKATPNEMSYWNERANAKSAMFIARHGEEGEG